ncbi:Ribosome hibernation promoting factor [Pseudoalteromonas holothuriae]|uniref:Ribosome hibernation promoting factor n=1 Tax=Pseudoalteromonas holothuriae TaxID=2963714 RepID=A0A9W4QYN7_9GAMM|nr:MULTISPECIES: ribosome-associated translation inhibitor RaiA [unclassified Pseudoalteromonas]CAH9059190.1 Ribosome hibernation promoting factor [Pseudoalteromonas sp. CIP111854]CAH9067843.1 Ribosome hibernation promoting factor [Pseudoalteromonas sp. CIP111951]
MKINLSGHHVDITDAVRAHVEEKFAKTANHFPSLLALDIIVSNENKKFYTEITTTYSGVRIAVKGEGDVMYPAIASAAKKLDASLKHRKGQLKADLHSKPVSTTPEIAHEIIQEMDLR